MPHSGRERTERRPDPTPRLDRGPGCGSLGRVRALVLSTSYPDSPEASAGRFVEELCAALRPWGVDAEVAFLGDGSGALHTARHGALWARARLAAQLPAWSMEAAAGVARQRPHVVLAHWVYPSAWIARLAAPGVPVVGVAHGGDGRLGQALPATLRPPLAGVLAVAPWLADAFPHPRTLVTPMGAWPASLAERSLPGREGDVLGGARPPVRALFVGRAGAEKGLGILLDALEELPHVTLEVVGAAPPAVPPARVRYRGPLPPSGVWRALQQADVLCVPSVVAEGAPRVVAEAAACGVRVLTSGAGGLPSVVPEAALVVPNTPQAWRAALSARAPGALPVQRPWPEVAERVAGFLRGVAKG